MSETIEAAQQKPQIDEATVSQALECVFNATTETLRQEANQYLMSCEENHLFPPALLSIFEKTQDQRTKLSAFMYLKSVIQRYWSVRSLVKNKPIPFPEELKAQIREYFVNMLGTVTDKNMRKHLNACIGLVINNEMPNAFPQIQTYFQSSLTKLYELLQQNQLNVLESPETMNVLKSCKIILKHLSKKRIHNQQPNQQANTNLQIVFALWEMLNGFVEKAIADKNLQMFELLTVISTALDKMLAYCLATLQTDIQLNEQVCSIIAKMLGKLRGIIELFDMVGKEDEVKQLLTKQIRSILSNTISIQISYPLAFASTLNLYLQIGKNLCTDFIKYDDDSILKCGLLTLYRATKQFTYYSTPEQYAVTVTKSKLPSYQQPQVICSNTFHQFFTAQKIEEILNQLILKVLPFHFQASQSVYTKNDDIIEKDDERYLDDAVNELENSVYVIAMNTAEQILLRFPQTCLNLLSGLIKQLIASNFSSVSGEVQESIFSLVGLIPKICQKIEIDSNTIIDFPALLTYLFNNHSTLPFIPRRIPILVSRWITALPVQSLGIVLEKIVELIFLHQESAVVRYECCMCLSEIVKIDSEALDYSSLITRVAPVIVELFAQFEVASVLWHLISFLSVIFQKCSSANQHDQLLHVLANTQLNNLLQTDSELLRGALVDMFIDLIVFFPPQTQLQPIYTLVITFIDNCLSKRRLDLYILKLWYFISKEYSGIQNLDEQMKALLFKHIGLLSKENEDEEIIIKALSIVEEYILLEFIPLNSQEILQYIEKTYVTAKNFEQNGYEEQAVDIKTQALNLLGTSILIMLNRNEQNILNHLQSIMKLLIIDLANNTFNKTIKAIPAYRAILQTIFNRFLISDFNAMIAFIEQCNVQPDGFLQTWFLNMEYAESKNTSKINTIAVLTVLPHVSQSTFTLYFGYALKRMLPDLYGHMELLQGQTPPEKIQNIFAVRSRKDEKIASARKKLLRKTQLYESFDLLNFFKKQIQGAFSAFNVSAQDLPLLIQDQARIDQFMLIMNSN